MPINYDQIMSAECSQGNASYKVDDVILYHLSVGAGNPPGDSSELQYTYEKGLKVLPSFTVVAPMGINISAVFKTPGLDINPAMILHGEQAIEIHQPLTAKANYKTTMKIAEIYDLGKAALLIIEVSYFDHEDKPMFTSRMSSFLRGEGGFGGPAAPKTQALAPQRAPDGTLNSSTLPQQALMYRLNGDKNPLHADPAFAKKVGFDKPILHGLCSYGIACKAIVDKVLDGDVTQVTSYSARFAGIAYPGETHSVSYWREGSSIFLGSKVKERGSDIITNAVITLKEGCP
ncbi:MAG: MaoC family dehydratase N-terminal domain-containing protein [Proteobacteria bacterium]|nr:MaoC family dehydratase N-terminal domain-containing protein [Pseudomonadota bacterium]